LDDFYLDKKERIKLSHSKHPLLITRGVPGTHDIYCLKKIINEFNKSHYPIKIPKFEKLSDSQIDKLVTNLASQDNPTSKILLNNFSFDWHSNAINHALNQFDILTLFKSFGSNVKPLLRQFTEQKQTSSK